VCEVPRLRILLCFTAGRGPFAWAIRKLTGSNVNHAFVAWESRELDGWVTIPQADERGCVAVAAESVPYTRIECYEADDYDLSSGLTAMRLILGLGYDWIGILGFLARLAAWRLLRRKIRNPWQEDDRFFCSEAATTFLSAAGVPWARTDRGVMFASSTHPGELRDAVAGDTKFKRLARVPWDEARR
jgi:hypothetical protein